MSTLLCALVATIAIINGQTYDDCGTGSYTVGGQAVSMQVERDSANSEVRLTFTGPTDQWYGFVIGSQTMSGYAITIQNSATEAIERSISYGSATPILTASGTVTADSGTVTLVRPYAGSGSSYFDFTDLMTCTTSSTDIALAIGGSTFAKHTATQGSNAALTFTSTCTCDPDTGDTPAPVTPAPVTPSPVTPSPVTPSPVDDTGATPSPVEDTDEYVICGTSELIDDVLLTVYKDETNEMVKIEVSGPPSTWVGYGFGSAGMDGAYAVIVAGADSDNLDVMQRLLMASDSSNPRGTEKTYGTTTITTTDATAVGTVEMAYDAADFDFTDFLTCQTDSIDLIAAQGSDTVFNYHATRVPAETLTRASTCGCTTSSANNIFNGFYVMIALFIGYLFM